MLILILHAGSLPLQRVQICPKQEERLRTNLFSPVQGCEYSFSQVPGLLQQVTLRGKTKEIECGSWQCYQQRLMIQNFLCKCHLQYGIVRFKQAGAAGN